MSSAKLLIYLAILPWCQSQNKTAIIEKTLSVNETVMLASPHYPVCCMEDVHYKLKCTRPACAFNITFTDVNLPPHALLQVQSVTGSETVVVFRLQTLLTEGWERRFSQLENQEVEIILKYPENRNGTEYTGFKAEVQTFINECITLSEGVSDGLCGDSNNKVRAEKPPQRSTVYIPTFMWVLVVSLVVFYTAVCTHFHITEKRNNKYWNEQAQWYSKYHRSSSGMRLIEPWASTPSEAGSPIHGTIVTISYSATNETVPVTPPATPQDIVQLPDPPGYHQALNSRYNLLESIEEEVLPPDYAHVAATKYSSKWDAPTS